MRIPSVYDVSLFQILGMFAFQIVDMLECCLCSSDDSDGLECCLCSSDDSDGLLCCLCSRFMHLVLSRFETVFY